MFIQVVCQNPIHTGRTRAKRRFDNGTKYRIEVVDRAEDFFVDAEKQHGDMTKINRAGYKALLDDPVFSVLEDGAAGNVVANELIESLKGNLARVNGDLSNARVENERLSIALKGANERIAKLEAELAGEGVEGDGEEDGGEEESDGKPSDGKGGKPATADAKDKGAKQGDGKGKDHPKK